MRIDRVSDFRLKLGEGPLWDARGQALYMVDGMGQQVLRYDVATGNLQQWDFPSFVGSLALADEGTMILALGNGIHSFDPRSGALTFLGDPEADDPITQWNDGKTDRQGRFVTGTVATDMKSENCGLYVVDRGDIRQLDSRFGLTNGPCFSPDGSVLYVADSRRQLFYAYDYDGATGTVTNRRNFCSTADLGGIPDGATVDRDGRLWSAICNAGTVACWNVDGTIHRTIAMPTKLVSSVMFGGERLDTLYVTSINPKHLPFLPDMVDDGIAGGLFAITGLGATGIAETLFAV